MAAVMASDSQILALSTMFTEDVFAHYGGKAPIWGDRSSADWEDLCRTADSVCVWRRLRAPEIDF